jgi:hypothetical protein
MLLAVNWTIEISIPAFERVSNGSFCFLTQVKPSGDEVSTESGTKLKRTEIYNDDQ